MIIPLSSKEIFTYPEETCIIDVRSPKEFAEGHIPGACNIPLFSNEQRALVGCTYKHQGKQDAIKKGLELIGPNMTHFAEDLRKQTDKKKLIIYCARGGMRSKSMAMLFGFFGYEVYQLEGGYKGYKKFLREQAERPYTIILLGGKTGTGKTKILEQLAHQGEQVIDLEGLANHKGSVFGSLNEPPQPTQDTFSVMVLTKLAQCDPTRPIWIEKESYKIGNLYIPERLWQQMQSASVVYITITHEERVANLMQDYGTCSKESLKTAVRQLTKKLGSQRTAELCNALDNNNYRLVVDELLGYYDKLYEYGLERESEHTFSHINLHHESLMKKALLLQEYASSFPVKRNTQSKQCPPM